MEDSVFIASLLRIRNRTLAVAIGVASLLIPSGARAAAIEINPGEWTQFTFPRVGEPALNTLQFKASPTGARLAITDAGASADRFSLSVNGTSIGTTSSVAKGFSCGFNAETCYLSSQMSKGNFELTEEGVQNIEVTAIANAFSAFGGVGFIRPETSFVNLYGNDGLVTRFTNLLNSASKGIQFYAEKLNPASPFTQLFADIKEKSVINTFGSILNQITSGIGVELNPNVPIDILLLDDVGPVWGGAACSNSTASGFGLKSGICTGDYRFQALDLAELEKLKASPNHDSPASIIAHELAEAVNLGYGATFATSHENGITIQNEVLADTFGSKRDDVIGARMLPSGFSAKNLYFDAKFKDPLLKSGKIQDYSKLGNLWYKDEDGKGALLFPWIDPSGANGWSIWVMKSSVKGWTFADLASGFIDTGVPWSGRDIDITLESIDYEPSLTNPDPSNPAVPGPLPLLGVGAAFGYSRKLRKRIKSAKLPVAGAID